MNSSFYSGEPSCPPPRQARGTRLQPIEEDTRESQYSEEKLKVDFQATDTRQSALSPRLRLKTSGLSIPSSRFNRFFSPISAGTMSSCSDTEWQNQMQGFDDLYDATDDESDASDECTSYCSTRPTSLVTPTTRNSITSPASRNRYPTLTIPPSNTWPSNQGAPKSSPVPPTPPPKIPVSPAALSLLTHTVPALHAPPSLDGGSVSSDQVSNISAPATPDLQSLPDNDWNARGIHLRPDLESQSVVSDPDASSDIQSIDIAIEGTEEDWRHVLGNFPQIPSGENRTSPSVSLNLDDEPVREDTPSDQGVFLPDDALAMLQHIPLDGTPDPWSETSESNDEMWQIGTPERPRSAGDATPASALSGCSFSNLSIPSPGGFFASLGVRARHTWSIPQGSRPPTSAVAENFYNLPFSRNDGQIVEQVIELPERSTEEQLTAVYAPEGPPTAIRIPPEIESRPPEPPESPASPDADVVNEIPRPAVSYEYDEHYGEELQQQAMASLDRTSVWLAAQESYLAALNETNPVNIIDNEGGEKDTVEENCGNVSPELSHKRSVRFAEAIPEATSSGPSALASRDSIYWRGFQFVRKQSGRRDSFTHRDMRFDAVQSNRLGLTGMHANCLRGNYELVRPERPPYKGPFAKAPRNSVIASVLAEKAQFTTLEKEQLVLTQINQPMWAIDALKYLNGGRLIASPASNRLPKRDTSQATRQSNKKRRMRILDLGGHVSCEWAWDLAHDHPEAQVYTVFTQQQAVNHGIKGPVNHRPVSVQHLWKLPFPDNKFDVISARSLPALLKNECPAGENKDEYSLCLQECYRCLKPGGYLEYFVMDAEISHAGPYASATSVEFGFNLKTRGYDPAPTKSFLCRLRNEQFVGIKRAWMFLPVGVEPVKRPPPRETPEPRVKSQIEDTEAVQGPIGSTADVASLTGLLGGWIWEQWMLKLQVEMGKDTERLLEGIGGVFDEGRKNGAGWTCLSGWAMKPKRRKQIGSREN